METKRKWLIFQEATCGIKSLRGMSSSCRRAQNSQENIWEGTHKNKGLGEDIMWYSRLPRENVIWRTLRSGEKTIRSWPSRTTRRCSNTLSWVAFAYSKTIWPDEFCDSLGISTYKSSSKVPLSYFILKSRGRTSAVASKQWKRQSRQRRSKDEIFHKNYTNMLKSKNTILSTSTDPLNNIPKPRPGFRLHISQCQTSCNVCKRKKKTI